MPGRTHAELFAAAMRQDVLLASRLERFSEVSLFRRSDIVEIGLDVVRTFRRPHVTIAHHDLNTLVIGLRSCDHETFRNRHHQEGSDRG